MLASREDAFSSSARARRDWRRARGVLTTFLHSFTGLLRHFRARMLLRWRLSPLCSRDSAGMRASVRVLYYSLW